MSDSAAERLAQSRQAILDQALHRKRRPAFTQPTPSSDEASAAPSRDAFTGSGDSSPWTAWRAVGLRYWQQHPAHALAELARPGMAAWGSRRPWTFLACSMAAGGALMLARPWKLISVTGLLVALAKTAAVQAASRPPPPLKDSS